MFSRIPNVLKDKVYNDFDIFFFLGQNSLFKDGHSVIDLSIGFRGSTDTHTHTPTHAVNIRSEKTGPVFTESNLRTASAVDGRADNQTRFARKTGETASESGFR